jgi:hypothetical protein
LDKAWDEYIFQRSHPLKSIEIPVTTSEIGAMEMVSRPELQRYKASIEPLYATRSIIDMNRNEDLTNFVNAINSQRRVYHDSVDEMSTKIKADELTQRDCFISWKCPGNHKVDYIPQFPK